MTMFQKTALHTKSEMCKKEKTGNSKKEAKSK